MNIEIMSYRLNFKEHRIIETTKKEGERLYDDIPASKEVDGNALEHSIKKRGKSPLKAYIFFILIFIILAFLTKLVIYISL